MRLLLVIVAVVILGIAVKYAVDYYYDRPFRAQRAIILQESRQIDTAKDIYATEPLPPVRGEDDIDKDGRTDFKFDPQHWYIRIGTSWVEIGMSKSDPKRGCRTFGGNKLYHFVDGEWIPKSETHNSTSSTTNNFWGTLTRLLRRFAPRND